MMEGITLIIGVSAVSALLLLFYSQLDEEHVFLKTLLVLFFVTSLMLISKTTLDNSQHCSFVVDNTTITNVLDNATIANSTEMFFYDYKCEASATTTSIIFHRMVTYLVWLFGLYVFIFYLWKILKFKGLVGKP